MYVRVHVTLYVYSLVNQPVYSVQAHAKIGRREARFLPPTFRMHMRAYGKYGLVHEISACASLQLPTVQVLKAEIVLRAIYARRFFI